MKRLKISFRSSSYAKYGRDSRQEKNVAFCFTNFLYHNFFCDVIFFVMYIKKKATVDVVNFVFSIFI